MAVNLVRFLFRRRKPSRWRLLKWLPLIFLFSVLTTAPVYYLPKTVLPVMKPEMTWAQVFDKLTTQNKQGEYHWTTKTVEIFGHYDAVFWATQLPTLVLVGLWLVAFVRYGQSGLRAAKDATHGSTRWKRPNEFGQTLIKIRTDQPDAAGLVVGADKKTAWVTNPNAGNPHALVIGATRSGKSRRVIMPTIFTIGHKKESMVITDPKGEIYGYTADWLRSQGYEVNLINLHEPTRGQRWNPMERIRSYIEQGNIELATRDAWEIGNILAFGSGHSADQLWPKSEESLIAALVLAVAYEADPGARHMATVYRLLIELGCDGGASLDDWLRSLPYDHPARLAHGTAALSESRTRSGIYTGSASNLRLWADPAIAWLCSESDFVPADAGKKPMATFILMPDEMGARRHIASLFVNQMYAGLAGLSRQQPDGKLPVPVWFLLDEFGNIGKVPSLAEKLTVAAGRGIRFVLAIQAKAQLEHVYGKDTAEIVLANCDTWVYLRTADLGTAREISAKAGTYTIVTQSTQRRAGQHAYSQSEGTTGRALLTPDEVLRWNLGESLLLQAGQFPARMTLQDMSQWSTLATKFQLKHEGSDAPLCTPVPTWMPGQKHESRPQAPTKTQTSIFG